MDCAIQLSGANARARGESRFSNPFYSQQKMPAATGETIDKWNAKAEAWTFGWEMEDVMRASG